MDAETTIINCISGLILKKLTVASEKYDPRYDPDGPAELNKINLVNVAKLRVIRSQLEDIFTGASD